MVVIFNDCFKLFLNIFFIFFKFFRCSASRSLTFFKFYLTFDSIIFLKFFNFFSFKLLFMFLNRFDIIILKINFKI